MTNTYLAYRFFLFAFISLSISNLFIGCTGSNDTNNNEKPNRNSKDSTNPNSINIRFAPGKGLSEKEIKAVFHNAFPSLSEDSVKVRSCPCDPTLANITLPQNWTIIKGQDPGKATVKNDSNGAGMDIFLAEDAITGINQETSTGDDTFNRDLKQPDPKIGSRILLDKKDPKQTIKVAIFDSGLENPSLNTHYLPASLLAKTSLCKEGKLDESLSTDRGWNFINDGPVTETYDTYSGLHGSRVTYLLANQFNATHATPQIVPMRVLDKHNKGDLFGLMCAMETARLNKVKVFNISLGYYGKEDSLFKSYVKKAVDDGIWLVTAAGNQPNGTPRPATTMELATMKPKFYPAYFSKEFSTVLAVTTVLVRGKIVSASAFQNYDQLMVWGVQANQITGNQGRFVIAPGEIVFGTSFATPILAGWVAGQLAKNPTLIPSGLSALPRGTTGNQVRDNAYLTPAP